MADKELALVKKVELKIVLANSDEKLQSLLKLYLPPLLLKLKSPHAVVRNKVVEVCQHINQRAKSSGIRLPVDALLAQLKENRVDPALNSQDSHGNLLRSFDLMYIEMGIGALSGSEQEALIPNIIDGISKEGNSSQNANLFRLFLKLLKSWTPPVRGSEDAEKRVKLYQLDVKQDDAQFICEKFTDLFNLDLSVFYTKDEDVNMDGEGSSPRVYTCPGVNAESFTFLTSNKKETFSGADMFLIKQKALKFLISAGLSDEQLFLPLLMASHESRTEISNTAEDYFKRLRVDLEDEKLIATLYKYALGTGMPQAKLPVVSHIVQLLCRSKYAASYEPYQIIEMGMSSDYKRLTQNVVQFVRWVAKECEDSKIQAFAKNMVQKLFDWITSTGWPKLDKYDTQVASLRANAYEASGVLMKRVPSIFRDMSFIKFLFDSLENDTRDMKPSIQEALSEVLPVLNFLSEDAKVTLKGMLLKYFYSESADQSCRYVAVRYAVRTAPFDDPIARLICLLALSRENRPDVIEEARRGLNPYWYKLVNSQYHDLFSGDMKAIEFPDFHKMLTLIIHGPPGQTRPSNGAYLYGLQPLVYVDAVAFLEQVLVMNAVKNKPSVLIIDDQWETNFETAISTDKKVRGLIREFCSNSSSGDILEFIDMAFTGVKKHSIDFLKVESIWLRTLSLSPEKVVSQLSSAVPGMVALLRESSRFSFIEVVSHTLGIVGTSDLQTFQQTLSHLVSDKSSTSVGDVLASSFVISRSVMRGLSLSELPSVDQILADVIELSNENADSLSRDAATEAITQLSLSGCFDPSLITEIRTKLLLSVKKDSERALFALGCLPINDESLREEIIDIIFANSNSKHLDLMFSSGEALTMAVSGWDSSLNIRLLDINSSTLTLPKYSTSILSSVVLKVIEHCKSSKPSLRKYACIWLLSLTQYCGSLPEMSEHFEIIHLSFMRFLADRDEVTQEAASRGLSLVYEYGDSDLKETLIKGLVKSFTSDSSYGLSAGSVSEDTELFEPGVLNTDDGSISTYKDILSLASEVGDPSLVYKFMSFAARSTLWASRKGAAFGLGNILSKANFDNIFQSNEALSKTLIPKLYRYRFDPNYSVQQTMRGIWDSLIDDKSKTVEANFDNILDELLRSMGDREWRVRQASALALSDLLQGQRLPAYQDKLESIWKMSFRALDDIKDSVREAGLQLTRGLATSLIRYVDVSSGESEKMAEMILKDLIPFLMGNNGLQSDSEDVRSFSLDTLLKVCKQGGKSLKPYIPGLIEEIIDLLSTLEPQAMNYLALNADKYGLTSEAIDTSRMNSLGRSPLMDAIEQMIDQIDGELLKDLVPRLSKVVRKSVGLPSKLGASRVLVTLVIKNSFQLAPFADTLLKAGISQIADRNETVGQSYSIACGYLARAASLDSLLDYAERLKALYFESETDRHRLVSGVSVNALSKNASDKFSSVISTFLPFVYIAKHDVNAKVKENFERVWSDNTGGDGAIKLYTGDIISLVNKHIDSRMWVIRQTVAKSVADLAKNLGTDAELLSPLYEALVRACSGKSWDGKEVVLEGLVQLVLKTSDFLKMNPDLLAKLDNVMTAEVKRRNKKYQIEAIGKFGKYCGLLPKPELYGTLFDVCDGKLLPKEDEADSESEDDADGDDVKMKGTGTLSGNIAKEETRNTILEGAVASFSIVDRQNNVLEACDRIWDKLQSYMESIFIDNSITVTWRSKIALISCATSLMDVISKSEANGVKARIIDAARLMKLWDLILIECSQDLNLERVRVESVRAAKKLLPLLEESGQHRLQTDIARLADSEKSPVVIAEITRAFKEK